MSDVESPNLVLTFNTLNMMKMLEYLIKSYFCRIVMSGVHCHVHLYLLSILTFQLNKNHFYSEIDKLGPVIASYSIPLVSCICIFQSNGCDKNKNKKNQAEA